jgi:hypothetical protein
LVEFNGSFVHRPINIMIKMVYRILIVAHKLSQIPTAVSRLMRSTKMIV